MHCGTSASHRRDNLLRARKVDCAESAPSLRRKADRSRAQAVPRYRGIRSRSRLVNRPTPRLKAYITSDVGLFIFYKTKCGKLFYKGAGIELRKCPCKFFLSIHHNRTMPRYWLTDGFTRYNQKTRGTIWCKNFYTRSI